MYICTVLYIVHWGIYWHFCLIFLSGEQGTFFYITTQLTVWAQIYCLDNNASCAIFKNLTLLHCMYILEKHCMPVKHAIACPQLFLLTVCVVWLCWPPAVLTAIQVVEGAASHPHANRSTHAGHHPCWSSLTMSSKKIVFSIVFYTNVFKGTGSRDWGDL